MKEIPELDSVRGLAAAGVVLYHAFPFVFFLGWSCVDLFFVLSGYLITTIIIEHHRAPGFLRAFYARRALRIWPVYFLVLAGCLVMNRLSRQGYPAGTLGTVQHLTFTQNIQGIWGGSVPAYVYAIGPSWSVAIEEQFYLLWPLLLVAMGRRAALPAAFVFLVLSVMARVAGSPINVIIGRGDGLAFGCMLAGLIHAVQGRADILRKLCAALTVTACLACAYVGVMAWVWWKEPLPQWRVPTFLAFGALYFALIGLIVVYSGAWLLAPLRWIPLRGLGQVSYCLYMVHSPIMVYSPALLTRAGVGSGLLKSTCTWALIAIVPIGSYYLCERPILALKNRFAYGKGVGKRRPR